MKDGRIIKMLIREVIKYLIFESVKNAIGRPISDKELQDALNSGFIGIVREENHTVYSGPGRQQMTGKYYYAYPESEIKFNLGNVFVAQNKTTAAQQLNISAKELLVLAGYYRDDYKQRGISKEKFLKDYVRNLGGHGTIRHHYCNIC